MQSTQIEIQDEHRHVNIDMNPSMTCKPGGILTVCKNSARCASHVYHIVTNAAWFSDSQDHRQVDVDRVYNFLLPFCNLYLKHFKLLGSPRKCITGAQSG